MTIRTRLTVWYVAVLATTLALFGVLVYGALVRVVSSEIDWRQRVRCFSLGYLLRSSLPEVSAFM